MVRTKGEGSAQRLQALERGTDVNEGLLAEMGLLSITLTFDRGDGRIVKGMERIQDLYPPS